MTIGMPFLLETETIASAAALCSGLGLSFVELNMNFPPCQAQRLDPEELTQLKRFHHIDFTIHLAEDCDPLSINDRVRAAWLENIRDTLTLAKACRMPIINMHLPKGIYITLPDRRVYLHERYDKEYHAALNELKALCEQELHGTNIRVAIENTDGFADYEQEALSDLLRSPVFGLTLDIGHSHAASDTDIPFYQKHTEKLIHMHAHDALGKKNHLALGDGEIDLLQRLRWARDCRARVVLETKTVAALRQSVSWLPAWALRND